MKYLVMECHEDYAVLLDEQAGFVKAVNAGYAVGEAVEQPQLLKTAASSKHIIMKVTYGLAAIAACAALALGIGHYREYYTTYSNIRLSINPDVEMALNRHGQVLGLDALNEDGEMLIADYDPARQDKTKVSDDLIDRAIEMGFLSDGATIVFEIDAPDADLFSQYGIELRSEAAAHTQGVEDVEILILEQGQIPETQPVTYDEVVITIPTQAADETAPSETNFPGTPVPSVKPPVSDDAEDDSHTIPAHTAPPATEPPLTAPPATVPAVQEGDSGYEAGDSGYDDVSDDGDSGYDT